MSRRNVLLINNVWGGREGGETRGVDRWHDRTVSISRKGEKGRGSGWKGEGVGQCFSLIGPGSLGCLPSERQS